MTNNIILFTDSYKASQWCQYEPGTEYIYSYVESRGGRWDKTMFFGLQMFLKKYLTNPITREMIEEAAEFWPAHGEPFNREGWEHILNVHGGKFPVSIKAVPEGTVVKGHNVLATIVNTDPKCYWLTSYLETALLRAIWYGTTVATNSFACKQIIHDALVRSSDDPAGQIAFKCHDFGARGVNCHEGAEIGGAAHLLNFMGTDTVEGIMALKKYYGAEVAGFSIPAMEHSTVTEWGRDREMDSFRNMMSHYAKPGAIFACVSDSYDLWNAIDNIWGEELRQEVIDSGATLVVRPDSGDPTIVPVEAVERLGAKFGFAVNSKGYKVLPPCVRVIQGDGINEQSIAVILDNLLAKGWSADNLAFGQGGKLLQAGIDRDTLRFAMKCSAAFIGGEWRDVFKDPVTDHGKRSKKGRLVLVRENDELITVALEGNEGRDELIEVYRDGEVIATAETNLDQMRARANAPFVQLAAVA